VRSAISTTSDTDVVPESPPYDGTGGLVWVRDDHLVVWHTVEHAAAGLRDVIDVLAGTTCVEVVISPSQLKNLRGHNRSAGENNARFDAFALSFGALRSTAAEDNW
jgi:hypothetical protein